MNFEDPKLAAILDKLNSGSALDAQDAKTLYRSHDLHGIAALANMVREQRHGGLTWCRQDLGDPPIVTGAMATGARDLSQVQGAEYEPPLDPQLSGFGYLKHIAVARLMLPGVDHIVARHCAEVENVCQLALGFGADTLVGANIAELERQILACGREIALTSGTSVG